MCEAPFFSPTPNQPTYKPKLLPALLKQDGIYTILQKEAFSSQSLNHGSQLRHLPPLSSFAAPLLLSHACPVSSIGGRQGLYGGHGRRSCDHIQRIFKRLHVMI
ncbi:hypothetical protein HPP92_020284 [Vanilla planifolia]|uniref:Uncharacterized protein n=1 Tax=Vanilla planifolia TaxID=51239 RepID=A0A835Q3D8_VANPL|nr:hypothetical protein HPP92_020686 [Vanilla planifolia]KAG0461808.1 hypothetical protein HPP92_020284 [Vanilla planifolia]